MAGITYTPTPTVVGETVIGSNGINYEVMSLTPLQVAPVCEIPLDDQTATEVSYDNTTSGLLAVDVQDAIDEVYSARSLMVNNNDGTLTHTDGYGNVETFAYDIPPDEVSVFQNSPSAAGVGKLTGPIAENIVNGATVASLNANLGSFQAQTRTVTAFYTGGYTGVLAPGHWSFTLGENEVIASGRFASAVGRALGGSIIASGECSDIHAARIGGGGNGVIEATDLTSSASGYANNGTISSSQIGSYARGMSSGPAGANSLIQASGRASTAVGEASSDGVIEALSIGAYAGGYSNGANRLSVQREGAFAHGFALDTGSVTVSGQGAAAVGFRTSTDGVVVVSGAGAFVHGLVGNASVTSSGGGSFAGGRANLGAASISATGSGAFAHGHALIGGQLNATGDGAVALGYANADLITASGAGSFTACNDVDTTVVAAQTAVFCNGSGQMGIGVEAPLDKLHVNGNVRADSFVIASDKRIKENIKPLETDILEAVLKVDVVSFNMIDDSDMIFNNIPEIPEMPSYPEGEIHAAETQEEKDAIDELFQESMANYNKTIDNIERLSAAKKDYIEKKKKMRVGVIAQQLLELGLDFLVNGTEETGYSVDYSMLTLLRQEAIMRKIGI